MPNVLHNVVKHSNQTHNNSNLSDLSSATKTHQVCTVNKQLYNVILPCCCMSTICPTPRQKSSKLISPFPSGSKRFMTPVISCSTYHTNSNISHSSVQAWHCRQSEGPVPTSTSPSGLVLVVSVRLHHCPLGRNYHEDQSVLTGQIDSETSLGCIYTGRQFELCLWYAVQVLIINWWNCTFIRRESCNRNLCIQIKASFF